MLPESECRRKREIGEQSSRIDSVLCCDLRNCLSRRRVPPLLRWGAIGGHRTSNTLGLALPGSFVRCRLCPESEKRKPPDSVVNRIQKEWHPQQLPLGKCIPASTHALLDGHDARFWSGRASGQFRSSASCSSHTIVVPSVRIHCLDRWRAGSLPCPPSIPVRESDRPPQEVYHPTDSRPVGGTLQRLVADGRLLSGRHHLFRHPIHGRLRQVEKFHWLGRSVCPRGGSAMVRSGSDLGCGGP